MKDYYGNRKPYVYVMLHESDRSRVIPVLEAMEGKGLGICGIGQQKVSRAKKALAILVFVSDAFVQEQQDDFFAAKDLDVPLIPIMLEDVELPPLMHQAMYAQNSIPANRYPTARMLADRILTAEVFANPEVTTAQKRASRLGLGMLCGGAAAVLALLLVLLLPKGQKPPTEELVVQTSYENPFGFTQEDLDAIRGVTILGEHAQFLNKDQVNTDVHIDLDSLGHREQEQETVRWFWNEDGSEVSMTEYDLRFLQMMPNVQTISLAKVNASTIPDLSGLRTLRSVDFRDCQLGDIEGMANSTIQTFHCEDSTVWDFGPLSSCSSLQEATLKQTVFEGTDYSNFGPPQLTRLAIQNASHLGTPLNLSGLQQCKHLWELRIGGFNTDTLDGLAGLESVQQLYLHNFPNLRNISALRMLKAMTTLEIWDSYSLMELSPLEDCTQLRNMHLVNLPATDIHFMDALVNLENIGLHVQENNLDFLHNLKRKSGVGLYISGPIQDYSGLEAIDSFSDLHIHLSNQSYHELVEPYLENKTVINEMSLYECRDVRLEKLPKLYRGLIINRGDLKNFVGLKDRITNLKLENMQNLTSLNGLENNQFFHEMTINGCVRLTDWSALKGMNISNLTIGGVAVLPDFESFRVMSSLTLDSLLGITDLQCLEKMPNTQINLSLPGMASDTDLSALNTMQGHMLAVPPELEVPAMKLVETGHFLGYTIVFPEGEWRNELQFSLESLEELEILPDAVLEKITAVHLIGDTIYDPWEYIIWENWQGDKAVPYLHNNRTGENIKVRFGSIENLSQLKKLTGLQELSLAYQPLKSLNGIQQIPSLRRLTVSYDSELKDISPAFGLDALEWLEARRSGIDSIQGIQNLHRLNGLELAYTNVTDLSPLEQCDYSFANRSTDGFFLYVDGLQIERFPALNRIQNFNWLNISDINLDLRTISTGLSGSDLHGLTAGNMIHSQEDLEYVVNTFPNLRKLHFYGSRNVTDLSVLLRLDNLIEVNVDAYLRDEAAKLMSQKPSVVVNW